MIIMFIYYEYSIDNYNESFLEVITLNIASVIREIKEKLFLEVVDSQ